MRECVSARNAALPLRHTRVPLSSCATDATSCHEKSGKNVTVDPELTRFHDTDSDRDMGHCLSRVVSFIFTFNGRLF